jgi:glutamate/tyrosine decarboxylase-like PLP-dependent enzyme
LLDGIEHVDSFVFNPHKWLFTNFDCSAHCVRDPDALVRTLELDRLNERLLEALNDSGELYLTPNRVHGAYTIRLAIGQTATRRRHVEAAWQKIQATARALGR